MRLKPKQLPQQQRRGLSQLHSKTRSVGYGGKEILLELSRRLAFQLSAEL